MTRSSRTARIERATSESSVLVEIDLDGTGRTDISTTVPFYDHMLTALGKHSLIDLTVKATGDTHIDAHHTVEDVAICLGEALKVALGDKRGIARYGEAHAPMDETLTRCVLDISGRPHCVYKSSFSQPRLGEMDTEMFPHWFHSFAQTAGITLHIEMLYGENNHHIAESMYKALARALRQAVEIDPRKGDMIPSTKGVL